MKTSVEPASQQLRVIIADDHPVVRKGLIEVSLVTLCKYLQVEPNRWLRSVLMSGFS